jgi:hypothetical protein
MAINDVSELAVIGTVVGQQHVHTLHFKHVGAPADPEGTLIAEWEAACEASYRALFTDEDSPTLTYKAKQVCGTIPLRAPAEAAQVTILGTRPVNSQAQPALMAELVSERTAFAGRSYRGRFFLGGLREEDSQGNNLVTVALSRYALTGAYMTALLAAFGGAGTSTNFNLFVYSRKLAAAPGVQCQNTGAIVTGFVHPTLVSTMRSRRPGSGL